MITLARWAAITILATACGVAVLLGLGAGSCAAPKSFTAPTSQPTQIIVQATPKPAPVMYRVNTPKGPVAVPAGATIDIEYSNSAPKEFKDVQTGTSNAGKAVGDKVKLQGKAATFDLTSLVAGQGETEATAETTQKMTFLIILGALLIVAGIVVWLWLKQPTLGLALCVGGGAIITIGIVAATAPWVFIVVLGVMLAVVGFLVYKAYAAKKAMTAVNAAASGIDAIKTIGPADLKIQIDAVDYPKAQAIIDATCKAFKEQLTAASEKAGGVLAKFAGK